MNEKLLRKKLKLLKVRASSLKSELDLVKDIFHSACSECGNLYSERNIKINGDSQSKDLNINFQPDLEKQPDQELEIEKQESDPEVKKLFRKIALQAHPDKLIGTISGKEKEDKIRLYQRAVSAADHNDLLELMLIAEELDIEDVDLSIDKLTLLEKYIIDIKKEINHVQSTIMWQWFFCEDETQKEKLLQKLFEHLYE